MWRVIQPLAAYVALSTGTLLMLSMAVEYSSFRTDIHFLLFKQEYLPIPWWRAAFYIHVFTAVISLAAGLTQFSVSIRKNHPAVHRVLGRVYVINILLINFPSGMILAIYANGLLPTKLAFIILDSLWFLFTWKAFTSIRQGNVDTHRRFMIRSFALTFSAVTLRSWKIILGSIFHPDPLTLYMVNAWMGFVPNLLLAEWYIRKLIPAKNTQVVEQNQGGQNQNKSRE